MEEALTVAPCDGGRVVFLGFVDTVFLMQYISLIPMDTMITGSKKSASSEMDMKCSSSSWYIYAILHRKPA